MKTIFLDIDGTLISQGNDQDNYESIARDITSPKGRAIEGCAAKCIEWHLKGYRIIITTGRPSTTRQTCVDQLASCGILYDQLVMDLGPGPRYLVNNDGVNGETKAFAFNLETNRGIGDLNL